MTNTSEFLMNTETGHACETSADDNDRNIENDNTLPDHRRRLPEGLAAKFEAWAGRVLESEALPAGLDRRIIEEVVFDKAVDAPEDQPTDSYAIWSVLTALTQEIKLQGRTFSTLRETVTRHLELSEQTEDRCASPTEMRNVSQDILDRLNQLSRNRDNEIRAETERRVRREMLGVFLDMRERLLRGLQADQAGETRLETSWLDRLLGRAKKIDRYFERQEARNKGYALAFERLEDSLRLYGVSEIKCLGRPFDPHAMTVVDILETDEHPDGQVIEVYQPGYELNGDIFQTAKVKVTRRTAQTGSLTSSI
jgi:molecular chaperone GrpE (heat shock protein)